MIDDAQQQQPTSPDLFPLHYGPGSQRRARAEARSTGEAFHMRADGKLTHYRATDRGLRQSTHKNAGRPTFSVLFFSDERKHYIRRETV